MVFDPRPELTWGVVIPAGGLASASLAAEWGTDRKALVTLAGEPLVTYGVRAVEAAGIGPCVVVGHHDLREHVLSATWVPEAQGQMANARAGVEALPEVNALLFLPADAPLITPEGLRQFVTGIEARRPDPEGAWFAAGLCRTLDFRAELPDWPMKSLRLRDGRWQSGAFFATSRAGFLAAESLLQELAGNRRNQLAMAWRVGFGPMLKYLSGHLTRDDAERILARALGGPCYVIPEMEPAAVADLDEPGDLARLRAAWDARRG